MKWAILGLCGWVLSVVALLRAMPVVRNNPWRPCAFRHCVRDPRCEADPLVQPDCCVTHLMRLVRAVTRAANSVELVALAGTLLGAVRNDGRILPWTADVDVGVAQQDMPLLVEALRRDAAVHVFRDAGVWRVCAAHAATASNESVGQTVSYMDLYDMVNVTGEGVHTLAIPCNPLLPEVVYPLREEPMCLFNDTRACLRVMAQPERYLAHLYGLDWREPPPRAKQTLHGKGGHVCAPFIMVNNTN